MRRTQGSRRSEDGASLVEYVLLLSLIVLVCVVSVGFFGSNVDSHFSSAGSSVGAVAPGP